MDFTATVFCLAALYCVHILIRNGHVYRLRQELNHTCYQYNVSHLSQDDDAYKWCYDRLPSYETMLFSFKRLTPDSWLPKDIIDRLRG